jgi:hypothetical protein
MKAKTSYSTDRDATRAVAAVARELNDADARLVLYFASSVYEPGALSQQMAAAFPQATVVGCTTAGEIVTGQMLDNSLVAMALGSELIKRAKVAVAEGISGDPRAATRIALDRMESQVGGKLVDLDSTRFCGLILADGLSGAEETVMDEIGNRCNLTFVGGSAGDDLQFKKTHIFVQGQAHTGVAALILIETVVPFQVVKTQSFTVLPKALVATKVNQAKREVLEFDGRPAAQAYAAALGVPVAELAGQFMRHPLGLLAEGEPFVRSPQMVAGDAVRFYCQILEGMELHILESTNIVQDTAAALAPLGKPSALINFHCILRTLELKDKKLCPAYGAVFDKVPTIGFSTYGEAYIGHINQTSTILVFGS